MKAHVFSQYIAEFVGTFFLVFFGCGSMILAEVDPSFDGSFIPLIWGGVVSIMIYGVGHISGAHFNPAVTLSFYLLKKFPAKRILGYIVAQVAGGVLASLVHLIVWGNDHSFGATSFDSSVHVAFLLEFIMSFALMFVIASVATDSRAVGELAGIAIGSTVGLCAFVGGPMTKASMNPARSLAPALFEGDFTQIWLYLYLLVPCLGAMLGAKVYDLIRCHKEEGSDLSGCC